jgi:hypothetical protein
MRARVRVSDGLGLRTIRIQTIALQMVRCGITLLLITQIVQSQADSHERLFPRSKATIEKILATMQQNLAGRLPVLDGFAKSGGHPLDHYERGYYQARVQVNPASGGGSRVRVSVKVTAWYSDATASRSGYELLASNGRIEEDVLDQLAEQLASLPVDETNHAASVSTSNPPAVSEPAKPVMSPRVPASASANQEPIRVASAATSNGAAPVTVQPSGTDSAITAPSAVSRDADKFSASPGTSLENAERASTNSGQPNAGQPNTDKTNRAQQVEAESLEEILKNQAYPKNLVAVKKSGTAVVSAPSLTAKPIFLASLHDEFELLDFNRDWVHVRISGLSRGWIWRNSVEMPEGISDTDVQAGPAPATAADLFHVVREETAPFPGDWEPLRGKTVKILSVQKVDEDAKSVGPVERLAYAKFLLDKNYAELTKKTPTQTQELTGIVVIFDAADGGMIAATTAALQQWKAGTLSDSALWHRCFFDPPETFDSAGPSGSQ